MKIPIYQVDAFTDEVFGGNPAAVCPLTEWIDKDTMQKIAMENNLSETAFFVPKDDFFEIRWFTPKVEINLAGHPTLATAWVIYNELKYKNPVIRFKSQLSGDLLIEKDKELLMMDFPSNEGKEIPAPDHLIDGLGAEPVKFCNPETFWLSITINRKLKKLNPTSAY